MFDILWQFISFSGQLIGFQQTLVEHENGGKIPEFKEDIVNKVDRVRQQADDICMRAIPHVKRNYPQDYNRKLWIRRNIYGGDEVRDFKNAALKNNGVKRA